LSVFERMFNIACCYSYHFNADVINYIFARSATLHQNIKKTSCMMVIKKPATTKWPTNTKSQFG